MQVLAHWKEQGHKALVFTQTQQMLDIMDRAVHALGYRSAAEIVSCLPRLPFPAACATFMESLRRAAEILRRQA